MLEYTLKATQEMVDYVESHRSGDVWYNEDFKLEVGETCTIDGWGVTDRFFLMSKENGMKFSIPEKVVGLNVDVYQKAMEEDIFLQKEEGKRKEWLLKTDWNEVRVRAAVAALQGICSRDIKNADINRITEVCVVLADALVEKLKK